MSTAVWCQSNADLAARLIANELSMQQKSFACALCLSSLVESREDACVRESPTPSHARASAYTRLCEATMGTAPSTPSSGAASSARACASKAVGTKWLKPLSEEERSAGRVGMAGEK